MCHDLTVDGRIDRRRPHIERIPRTLLALVVVVVTGAPASSARAQDLEPRSYANTPVGLNFLLSGYVYQQGDVTTDPSLPLEDAKVSIHSTFLAYARSFGFFGTSAKVDVIVPYGFLSGSATFRGEARDRTINGFGDPRFRFSVNLYGAPALTLEEFADYHQDLIVGASLIVWAPLGQYDADKLVNVGSNRWAIKEELGISKAFGPLIVELAPSVTFFTDNDDFLDGRKRAQDPLYAVQAHVIYSFLPALWGAVDATYYGGGTTTIDGIENDDRQSNSRVGGTLVFSVTRRHSIKLYASTGVTTRIGGNYDVVGLALQYRWGGGL